MGVNNNPNNLPHLFCGEFYRSSSEQELNLPPTPGYYVIFCIFNSPTSEYSDGAQIAFQILDGDSKYFRIRYNGQWLSWMKF